MPITPIQSQFIAPLPEPISSPKINGLGSAASGSEALSGTKDIGKSFEDVLGSLSQSENQSDSLMQQLAAGGNVELHDVMISAEETDLNFRVVMAIRDKLVDAYREVMRMSI